MANPNVSTFGDDNFDHDVLKSDKPVLVDFWAPWCMPCKMIAPIVDQLANDYQGKAKVGKVNVDEAPGVAERYRVMSIPTLLVFKNGQPVGQLVGAMPRSQIEDMLKKAL